MNPLLKSKPSIIYSEYEATKKFTLPAPYNHNYKLFIDHMLPVLAKVRLYSNVKGDKISMYQTLRKIPAEGIEDFPFAEIRALIQIAAKVPRSALVKDMRKYPKYGSLTPLFMYAHKLYNNIEYKDWDADDKLIDVAIGSWLNKALEFHKAYPNIMDIEPNTRVHLAPKPYTSFPAYLNHSEDIESTEDAGYIIKYPKEWMILNCQYWLANVELRDTESMILDIKNFGRVPKALDVAGAKVEPPWVTNLDPATCDWA